jgi:hypothetical protein
MQRFSLFADDGVVKFFNLEPNGSGLTCSLSNQIVNQIWKGFILSLFILIKAYLKYILGFDGINNTNYYYHML